MYIYKAYNLIIHSELIFPELIATENKPDVTLRLGKLNHTSQIISNRGNCFFGEVPKVGTFLVRDGREIIVEPVPETEESLLRALILGPILSILLRQRELLVLHASSFASNDEAVAFMGDSGWGKSTLVEHFHAKGYSILTDDVMAIKIDFSLPVVIPGFPQIKLWPDAANFIGHALESLPSLHSQTAKLFHKLTNGFCSTPLPLKRIYVLGFGDRSEIIPLDPQESFLELTRHTRALSLLNAPEFVRSHFHQCTNLVQNVSICRLLRQRSLAGLPEVAKLIEEDLGQVVCQDNNPINVLAASSNVSNIK